MHAQFAAKQPIKVEFSEFMRIYHENSENFQYSQDLKLLQQRKYFIGMTEWSLDHIRDALRGT